MNDNMYIPLYNNNTQDSVHCNCAYCGCEMENVDNNKEQQLNEFREPSCDANSHWSPQQACITNQHFRHTTNEEYNNYCSSGQEITPLTEPMHNMYLSSHDANAQSVVNYINMETSENHGKDELSGEPYSLHQVNNNYNNYENIQTDDRPFNNFTSELEKYEIHDSFLKAPITITMRNIYPTIGSERLFYSASVSSNKNLTNTSAFLKSGSRSEVQVCNSFHNGRCLLAERCTDVHVHPEYLENIRRELSTWVAQSENNFYLTLAENPQKTFRVFVVELKEVINVSIMYISFTRGLYVDPLTRSRRIRATSHGMFNQANTNTGQAPTNCGLYSLDPNQCKWRRWCNQVHIDPAWLRAKKREFASWFDQLSSKFTNMSADHEFVIHDPQLKTTLSIPKYAIAMLTRGLFQGSSHKAPSVCLLFQRNRCTAGGCCNQVHVDHRYLLLARQHYELNEHVASNDLNAIYRRNNQISQLRYELIEQINNNSTCEYRQNYNNSINSNNNNNNNNNNINNHDCENNFEYTEPHANTTQVCQDYQYQKQLNHHINQSNDNEYEQYHNVTVDNNRSSATSQECKYNDTFASVMQHNVPSYQVVCMTDNACTDLNESNADIPTQKHKSFSENVEHSCETCKEEDLLNNSEQKNYFNSNQTTDINISNNEPVYNNKFPVWITSEQQREEEEHHHHHHHHHHNQQQQQQLLPNMLYLDDKLLLNNTLHTNNNNNNNSNCDKQINQDEGIKMKRGFTYVTNVKESSLVNTLSYNNNTTYHDGNINNNEHNGNDDEDEQHINYNYNHDNNYNNDDDDDDDDDDGDDYDTNNSISNSVNSIKNINPDGTYSNNPYGSKGSLLEPHTSYEQGTIQHSLFARRTPSIHANSLGSFVSHRTNPMRVLLAPVKQTTPEIYTTLEEECPLNPCELSSYSQGAHSNMCSRSAPNLKLSSDTPINVTVNTHSHKSSMTPFTQSVNSRVKTTRGKRTSFLSYRDDHTHICTNVNSFNNWGADFPNAGVDLAFHKAATPLLESQPIPQNKPCME